MAIIIIRRAERFTRGDLSIQVLLNGKSVGMLMGNNELSIMADAGKHELKAVSNGLEGLAYPLVVSGSEPINLEVLPPKTPRKYWWPFILYIVLLTPMTHFFGTVGWLVFMALYIAVTVVLLMRQKRKMRDGLCIQPADLSAQLQATA